MSKLRIKKHISLNLEVCMSHDISYPEWILCEQIQFLSVQRGYCYAKRKTLADALKMSVRGLQKMIDRLSEKGLIFKHENMTLKVTEKWLEFQEIREEKEVKKDTPSHEQSSPQARTKFTPSHEQSSPPTIKRESLSVDNKEKNIKKENSYENFIKLLRQDFKKNKLLTFESKINDIYKTKKAFKLFAEIPNNLHIRFREYVKKNRNMSARLDKWLVAVYEGNEIDLEYSDNQKLQNRTAETIARVFSNRETEYVDVEAV